MSNAMNSPRRKRTYLIRSGLLMIALIGASLVAMRSGELADGFPARRSHGGGAPALEGQAGHATGPAESKRASLFAAPRAAAQPAAPRTTAYLPLVAASADLRSDDIVREPPIPKHWTADADFVLGGPAMAIDVEGTSPTWGSGRTWWRWTSPASGSR